MSAPPPIRFSCPYCDRSFNMAGKFVGRKFPCPDCKETLTVPTADLNDEDLALLNDDSARNSSRRLITLCVAATLLLAGIAGAIAILSGPADAPPATTTERPLADRSSPIRAEKPPSTETPSSPGVETPRSQETAGTPKPETPVSQNRSERPKTPPVPAGQDAPTRPPERDITNEVRRGVISEDSNVVRASLELASREFPAGNLSIVETVRASQPTPAKLGWLAQLAQDHGEASDQLNARQTAATALVEALWRGAPEIREHASKLLTQHPLPLQVDARVHAPGTLPSLDTPPTRSEFAAYRLLLNYADTKAETLERLERWLGSDNASVRRKRFAFRSLSSQPSWTPKKLTSFLGDSQVGDLATDAFVRVATVREVLAELRSSDPFRRARAAAACRLRPTPSKQLLDSLGSLASTDPEFLPRFMAIECLGRLARTEPTAAKKLLSAFKQPPLKNLRKESSRVSAQHTLRSHIIYHLAELDELPKKATSVLGKHFLDRARDKKMSSVIGYSELRNAVLIGRMIGGVALGSEYRAASRKKIDRRSLWETALLASFHGGNKSVAKKLAEEQPNGLPRALLLTGPASTQLIVDRLRAATGPLNPRPRIGDWAERYVRFPTLVAVEAPLFATLYKELPRHSRLFAMHALFAMGSASIPHLPSEFLADAHPSERNNFRAHQLTGDAVEGEQFFEQLINSGGNLFGRHGLAARAWTFRRVENAEARKQFERCCRLALSSQKTYQAAFETLRRLATHPGISARDWIAIADRAISLRHTKRYRSDYLKTTIFTALAYRAEEQSVKDFFAQFDSTKKNKWREWIRRPDLGRDTSHNQYFRVPLPQVRQLELLLSVPIIAELDNPEVRQGLDRAAANAKFRPEIPYSLEKARERVQTDPQFYLSQFSRYAASPLYLNYYLFDLLGERPLKASSFFFEALYEHERRWQMDPSRRYIADSERPSTMPTADGILLHYYALKAFDEGIEP